jgi:hypothetical protein|tara:strand:+ start:2507 stop:2689 length:183 start_codon:yes stop_codon:yes gene_type:complete
MKTFTFEAYGKTFKAEAERGLDVMEDANRKLLWSNPRYQQGAWYDCDSTTYNWVEGNFFD